ncbi:MAG: tRNA-modifying protein YgfZ [Alphaproteobacteria bacterium MarineAlpha5_Bin5]|nr:MAG: tRNA-modifying protein YgfZ [Alphaproteobacteria bacterium MarineAlpha5_Bin5]PPR52284.1 MAG: tRNA-modifying protein YgfZ [Alphaproteobacteria bacterium MarineAlpha5_Bin4]|tara:strand:- start:2037 stop:2870 length:834 start_codon:yes stop_codon:yes gene_type:complete
MNIDFFIQDSSSKFIEIRGEDKAEFLQGLISNDIYKCKNDKPIYSCFLSPQGKFLADFFIFRQNDNYVIEIHEKYFESFLSKLKIYKLRSNVILKHNENITSIILFTNKDFEIKDTIIKFIDPRKKNIGKKVYINNKNLPKIDNLEEMYFNKYKEILMKNLVPFTPDDLNENKSLLLENNFQNLNAIDWDKGCYVGQEITARMKYRSLIKKQIYNLEIISGNINIGDSIEINNNKVGYVISKVNNYILCMLSIKSANTIIENKTNLEINDSIILNFL